MSGLVDTDITQIVEWGDLATFMLQDTRITARSAHGTIGYGPSRKSIFDIVLAGLATIGSDVSQYTVASLASVKASILAYENEPQYELLGEEQRAELTAAFKASKSANKPWQVYGSSVVVPDQLTAGNMYNLMDVFPADAATIKSVMDAVYPSAGGTYFRLMYALGVMGIGWNPDSWQVPRCRERYVLVPCTLYTAQPMHIGRHSQGYRTEREKLYAIFKENTNNAVVLSGDVHDFFAYSMQDKSGAKVGVNIVAGGVTSSGWGGVAGGLVAGFGTKAYNMFEAGWEKNDPLLKYAGAKDKGFWVMKVNSTHHIAESIMINDNDEAALATSSGWAKTPYAATLAAHYCDVKLTTVAGQQGSLTKTKNCEIKIGGANYRRRAGERVPVAPPSTKASCDCLFAEKLGAKCDCRA